tara:strand:- start:6476 stop:7066 length:591 start_codon:yes stop_codon:yes gene_type:complete
MSIVASGQVSIQDLVDEFGGTAPHNLNEYYRGGAFVDDITNNNSVPLSGEIQLKDFYGAGNVITYTVTEAYELQSGIQDVTGYWNGNKAVNAYDRAEFSTAFTTTKGSRTPTTLYGVTVQGLYYAYTIKSPNYYFQVILQGTRDKTFFSSATPQGAGTLLTSACDHAHFESSTIYSWLQTKPGAWDGSGTRTVTIV